MSAAEVASTLAVRALKEKGMPYALSCAAADNILILLASCRDGVGDKAYIELLGSARTPAEALVKIKADYRLGYHEANKIAEAAARASIRAVTELDEATLKKAFIAKRSDLAAAVAEAMRELGPQAKVAVLLDGTVTVPIVD